MFNKRIFTRFKKFWNNVHEMGVIAHSRFIYAYAEVRTIKDNNKNGSPVRIMIKAGTNDNGLESGVYTFDEANKALLKGKVDKMPKEGACKRLSSDILAIGDVHFGITHNPDIKTVVGYDWSPVGFKGDVISGLKTLLSESSSNYRNQYVSMFDKHGYRFDNYSVIYTDNLFHVDSMAIAHEYMKPLFSLLGDLRGIGTGAGRTAWKFTGGVITVFWPSDVRVFRQLAGPRVPHGSPEWTEYLVANGLSTDLRNPLPGPDNDTFVCIGIVDITKDKVGQIIDLSKNNERISVVRTIDSIMFCSVSNEGDAVSLPFGSHDENAPIGELGLTKAFVLVKALKAVYRDNTKMSIHLNSMYEDNVVGDRSPYPEMLLFSRKGLRALITGCSRPR